jgi:hypothetical protein
MTRPTFLGAGGLTVAGFLTDSAEMYADFNGLVAGMMREANTPKVSIIPLGANLFVIEKQRMVYNSGS